MKPITEDFDSFGIPLTEAETEKYSRDVFIYLEPTRGSEEEKNEFAQCKTCPMWTGEEGKSCFIHGPKDVLEVSAEDTCYLYSYGNPTPELAGKEIQAVTAEESGYAKAHTSRCENCRSLDTDSTCKMFKNINESMPDLYDLKVEVSPKGCCNLQVLKEK